MQKDVFTAIADPTRRAIISLLSHQPLNMNAVAKHFEVSRPAISKQVKILSDCGLVLIKKNGRDHVCHPNLHQIGHVAQWAEQYRQFWTGKLDALEQFLSNEETVTKTVTRKSISKTSKTTGRK